MDKEAFARTLSIISTVFNYQYRADGNHHMWFVSFGTLLYFLRDRLVGRPFNTDFDISVKHGEIQGQDLVGNMAEYGYNLKKQTISDVDGRPFQMVFTPDSAAQVPDIEIDVFFWVPANGYMWHTYDFDGENKERPTRYVFKGTPEVYFRAGTIAYTWDEIAPDLNFPIRYGAMLDTWYPPKYDANQKPVPNTGWFIPDRQFGQSRAPKQIVLPSCAKMFEELK